MTALFQKGAIYQRPLIYWYGSNYDHQNILSGMIRITSGQHGSKLNSLPNPVTMPFVPNKISALRKSHQNQSLKPP